jgi:hypothetical protein
MNEAFLTADGHSFSSLKVGEILYLIDTEKMTLCEYPLQAVIPTPKGARLRLEFCGDGNFISSFYRDKNIATVALGELFMAQGRKFISHGKLLKLRGLGRI